MSVNAFIGGNLKECLSVCNISSELPPKSLSFASHTWANVSAQAKAVLALFAFCKQLLYGAQLGVCVGWNERLVVKHYIFGCISFTQIIALHNLLYPKLVFDSDKIIEYTEERPFARFFN